jgi:uncharacterized protein (DUF697 family)
MRLPVDVSDLMKTGTRLTEERERSIRMAVFVEADTPDELIDAVRAGLRPKTAAAHLQIEVVEPGRPVSLAPGTDAVIGLAGSGRAGMVEALDAARNTRTPAVVVAKGDASVEGQLADALLQPTGDLVVADSAEGVVEGLGKWLSENLSGKRLALAHNYAFMRRAVAEDAVKTTAWQNGLVGTVSLIPGADMPIMTANQAKMLMQIAAAYGQPLGMDRIRELAAVVGGAFLLRTVARQALVVVPVLGWAIKGGIGYTGTVAMGKAAIKYFEEGADLSQVTAHFREIKDAAARRIPRRADRALTAGGGATHAIPTEVEAEDVAVPGQTAPPSPDESPGA